MSYNNSSSNNDSSRYPQAQGNSLPPIPSYNNTAYNFQPLLGPRPPPQLKASKKLNYQQFQSLQKMSRRQPFKLQKRANSKPKSKSKSNGNPNTKRIKQVERHHHLLLLLPPSRQQQSSANFATPDEGQTIYHLHPDCKIAKSCIPGYAPMYNSHRLYFSELLSAMKKPIRANKAVHVYDFDSLFVAPSMNPLLYDLPTQKAFSGKKWDGPFNESDVLGNMTRLSGAAEAGSESSAAAAAADTNTNTTNEKFRPFNYFGWWAESIFTSYASISNESTHNSVSNQQQVEIVQFARRLASGELDDLYRQDVLDALRLSIADPTVLTVIICYRPPLSYQWVVEKILAAKQLLHRVDMKLFGFDKYLTPQKFRIAVAEEITKYFGKQAEELVVYDRKENISGWQEAINRSIAENEQLEYEQTQHRLATKVAQFQKEAAEAEKTLAQVQAEGPAQLPMVPSYVPIVQPVFYLDPLRERYLVEEFIERNNLVVDSMITQAKAQAQLQSQAQAQSTAKSNIIDFPKLDLLRLKKSIYATAYLVNEESQKELVLRFGGIIRLTGLHWGIDNIPIVKDTMSKAKLLQLGGLGSRQVWQVESIGSVLDRIFAAKLRLVKGSSDAVTMARQANTMYSVPMLVIAYNSYTESVSAKLAEKIEVWQPVPPFNIETTLGFVHRFAIERLPEAKKQSLQKQNLVPQAQLPQAQLPQIYQQPQPQPQQQ